MYKASYYYKHNSKITCLLCPHNCILQEGQTGTCGVRTVQDGELYTANYGKLAADNWDPVEKKPLYHFHPGRQILSLGTYGCNLLCSFCQNWSLARGNPSHAADTVKPEDVLAMLDQAGGPEKALGVAYTYNEPAIWYEFVYDTARLLNKEGYSNVLVTNGYISREPLQNLLPYIDAMNIDVKAFRDHFYKEYCQGKREPVIETVETAVKQCHIEITCLLIPTLNDGEEEQEALVSWLASLSPDIVLHYSRYFPQYKMDLQTTPVKVMEEAKKRAENHLNYVYLGNIDLPGSADTICPYCGNLLVKRTAYQTELSGLTDDAKCNNCGNNISIVMS
ncbi:MAG: AmmeMemoRadiSam system radical SAM enzyme [Bacillota bacterium]